MKIFYLINGQRYLDAYLLRKNFNAPKEIVRRLLKGYDKKHVLHLQNKELYPVSSLVQFAKKQLTCFNEENANAQK